MVKMRLLLSEIDLLSVLQRTSADFGETTYPPGGSYGPAWVSFISLILIHSGRAEVSIPGAPPLFIPAGCLSLRIPGHQEYWAFDRSGSTHHAWIHLYLDEWPPAIIDRLHELPPVLPVSNAMVDLVAEGLMIKRGALSTAMPLLASLASSVLWLYVGEAESDAHRPDEPVERARRFIHSYMNDSSVDLSQIAAAANVSPSHLVRRFRRELGITPMAYLWQRRVAIGVDLLNSTGLQISDIAGRVGFSSVYHFSRRVKAHTGLSPTEVRRQRWNTTKLIDQAP
jgi:AraC-like DNA-binding protein